tara:strand:- start:72 stop:485 length:414 start_codon:yes stop_codon:yes gene_type:complete
MRDQVSERATLEEDNNIRLLPAHTNKTHHVFFGSLRCDVQLLVEGVCLFPYILKPGFRCKTFGDEDEVNLITANLMAQSQHTKSALGSSLPRSCVCCNILMKKSEAVRFEKLKDEDRALLEEVSERSERALRKTRLN